MASKETRRDEEKRREGKVRKMHEMDGEKKSTHCKQPVRQHSSQC